MPPLRSHPLFIAMLVAIILFPLQARHARADDNLFANPGFETGDFAGWTVGGLAESGVDVDGTPITGTVVSNNEVNVHAGTYAAWAKEAEFAATHFLLSQTVDVAANTNYELSFWAGLAGDANAGRHAIITVGGETIYDASYAGVIGSGPEDFVQVTASWNSGDTSGPVTVTFDLRGSGTGVTGFSYDDFAMTPVSTNLLANPGFEICDFTGWTVGGLAESGVDVDDTPITGTIISNNVVNVHSGSCAAWAKEANFENIHFILSQTVNAQPDTYYEVSFWAGLGGDANAGRSAVIDVAGETIFNSSYAGVIGTDPGDYVQVTAGWRSGSHSGPVTVTFMLKGSGSGLSGFSYDDFSFAPAPNLLANPGFETCDFTGWTVGGAAESGVGPDDLPLTGTIISNNVVNVHGGSCAAWAKEARVSGIHFELSQTVDVVANTVYEVSFWAGLGGDANAGRHATLTVGTDTIFDDFYNGTIGTDPEDCVQVKAFWNSGATSGPVDVLFHLEGSGTGKTGFSYDDLVFRVAGPSALLAVDDPAPWRPVLQLGSAQPNPFRIGTSIPFRLAEAGRVRLDVFDVRGARVRTLVDGEMAAGMHTARWDGTGIGGERVRAGVYFARLRAGDASVQRTLVLTP